jgi:hypothetical protein
METRANLDRAILSGLLGLGFAKKVAQVRLEKAWEVFGRRGQMPDEEALLREALRQTAG